MISYFLAVSVEALAALILIQTLGKWKEVIIFSFIVVFILQFSFRSEMRSLSHLRMYDPESIPTNLPKDGFEFLKLEGYRFSDHWDLSDSITHKTRDAKGRDNSHTSHYEIFPLVNQKNPEEPIRLMDVAKDRYLYHIWRQQDFMPNFAKILPETKDLQSTLKDWEKKYPTVAKNKITWLALYESRESYLDSQASLLLFLHLMTPTVWFFVGFVWIVREGLHSLFHFFRS